MSESIYEVSVRDFDFAIELAKERAKEVLKTEDPQVIATLANTLATLAVTRAIDALKGDS